MIEQENDIRPARQRLIEANTLHPLVFSTFNCLQSVAPIATLLALPILSTASVLLLIEFELIKKEDLQSFFL